MAEHLVCFYETFVAITVFVRQMNNPVLKRSIVQELLEFMRILTFFTVLSIITTEDIIE